MAEHLDWKAKCKKRHVCDSHCGTCDDVRPSVKVDCGPGRKFPREVSAAGTPDRLAQELIDSLRWIIDGIAGLEAARRVLEERLRESMVPQPVSVEGRADKSALAQEFADWMAAEMPAGTVIGDPRWWAGRVLRKVEQLRISSTHPAAERVTEATKAMEDAAYAEMQHHQDNDGNFPGLVSEAHERAFVAAILTAALAARDAQ